MPADRRDEGAIARPAMPAVEAWYERLRVRPAYLGAVCIPFDDLVGKENY